MNPYFVRAEGSGILVVDEVMATVVDDALIARER
jgi:hypothetical protein